MNREQAQTAVAASALIVGGVYAYRRLVETAIPPTTAAKHPAAQLVGVGPTPPIGRFITGWGVTYLVLALLAQAAPSFGGSFAVLIAAGDLLGNGTALAADVTSRLNGGGGSSPKAATPQTANGVPVMQPGETGAHFDQRLNDYLRNVAPAGSTVTTVSPLGVTRINGRNPLTVNPFTEKVNPLIR